MEFNTDFRSFHNRLRILMNIDKHEFDEALSRCDKKPEGDGAWLKFREHPYAWFVACRGEWAKAIFAVVREREGRP